jgi:hypothetical protein
MQSSSITAAVATMNNQNTPIRQPDDWGVSDDYLVIATLIGTVLIVLGALALDAAGFDSAQFICSKHSTVWAPNCWSAQ